MRNNFLKTVVCSSYPLTFRACPPQWPDGFALAYVPSHIEAVANSLTGYPWISDLFSETKRDFYSETPSHNVTQLTGFRHVTNFTQCYSTAIICFGRGNEIRGETAREEEGESLKYVEYFSSPVMSILCFSKSCRL